MSKEQNNLAIDKEDVTKKDELLKKLETGVSDIMDSEKFRNWCKTSSYYVKSGYSFRNSFLINVQNPNASYVMGYQAWKNFGRQVSKGSTGIHILVPSFAKEYGGKGSLFNAVNKILDTQLKKDSQLPYASYRLGQSDLGFRKTKNNIYEITLNNNVIQGQLTAEQLRKYIDRYVIGKVVTYYGLATVFDVKDTAIPEFLYVKTGYKQSELVKDDKGNPIKTNRGEYKIYNTIERQSLFSPKLDFEIKESDNVKMQTLFSVLEKISQNNNYPLSLEDIQDKDLYGYCSYAENKIVINNNISLTEKVSTLFHEIAHSEMHNKSDKPTSEKEIEAEAVAYTVAGNFNIETSTNSFNYIAMHNKSRDLKEIEASLNNIFKESKALMTKIETELEERGLNLNLDPLNKKLLEDKEIKNIIKETKEFIVNKANENTFDLSEFNQDYKELSQINEISTSSMSIREMNILDEQIQYCKVIDVKISKLDKLSNELDTIKDVEQQQYVINAIKYEKDKLSSLTEKIVDLATERNNYVKAQISEAIEDKSTTHDLWANFKVDPLLTLETLQERHESLQNLTRDDINYISKSVYVKKELSPLLSKSEDKFVENITKQVSNIKDVVSKNGSFVEINSCEKWGDNEIFKQGSVIHPKLANKLFAVAETKVHVIRQEAKKNGAYYPFTNCNFTVFSKVDNELCGLQSSLSIGDKSQKDMSSHLSQMAIPKNSENKITNILNNYNLSLCETGRFSSKLMTPDFVCDRFSINEWTQKIIPSEQQQRKDKRISPSLDNKSLKKDKEERGK